MRFFLKKKFLLNRIKNCKSKKNIFNIKKEYYDNFIVKIKKNNLFYPRIGYIISKKIIKLSNKRNKIKRIIKEYFRLNQYKIINCDYIIIIIKEIYNFILFKKKIKLLFSNKFYLKL